MELQHLRSFLVFAQELHFGRAADRLGLTQPSLSRRIQQIEAMVGVALVDRAAKPLRLTPAGEAYLEEASRAVALLEAATSKARQAATGQTGRLRIGFPTTFSHGLVPQALEQLRTTHPNAKLTLRELPISTHVQMLRADEVDVCLTLLPASDPALMQRHLWDESLVAILPEKHRLSNKVHLALRDLARETFVFCPSYRSSGFHEMVLQRCRSAGLDPNVAQEVDSNSLLLDLVARNTGVSLAPASLATIKHAGVVFRPINDALEPLHVGVIWRKQNDSILRRRFVDAAVACVKENQLAISQIGHVA